MSTNSQTAVAPPAGPRRGGRRGGGAGKFSKASAGNSVNAAAAQPDDTEEVRVLRAKYADKLAMLKELFPDWTDEDLLFALQEAGGEVELAVMRISDGHAEQFSSVKSKKQTKKETGSTVTPSTFHGATAPSTAAPGGNAGSGARGGRGGIAGAKGRGGATVRGARGVGRGGLRGNGIGRGGASVPVEGKHTSDVTNAGTSNTTPAGATWADAVAATSSKSNGVPGGDWGDDTEGLDFKTNAAATTTAAVSHKEAVDSVEQPASLPAAAAATTVAPPEGEEPGKVATALAKIIPSKLIPKGSKMSWAQVARPVEPAKPAVSEPPIIAAAPVVAPTAPAADRAQSSEPTSKVAEQTISTAEADAAINGSKPSQVENVAESIEPSSDIAPAPESASLPPGLGSSTSAPLPVATEVATTPATIASKPAFGRAGQSQRAIQRAKQDAPVVMAGNNSQYDNLGVRFGSLNFLGGDDNDAQTDEVAPLSVETTQTTLPSAAPALTEATNTTAAAPAADVNAYVQQQTQTAPSHQDAFTQASSSPYNGSKPETVQAHQYGYQQGMSQHQQAHQAAVTQAQQQHQQLSHQHQASATPVEQQQPTHQQYQIGAGGAGTGGFTSGTLGGQSNQSQQQQLSSQYGDYYANLDAQRLSSFYGYDQQQSALNSRGNEDRSSLQSSQQAQPISTGPASADAHSQQHQHHHHQSHPSAAQQANPQQQQQFANVMPYYYPHYYLPTNQFQHYGQPGAGYGQYAMYGQQQQQQQQQQPPQQNPTKPTTPASHQSPYAQNGPADLNSGGTGGGQYGQSPATGASALVGATSGIYGDYNRQGAPNLSNNNVSDYSKLYGNTTTTPQTTHSSSIPGLGGFLGQTPSGPANGNNSQLKNGGSGVNSNALENAYRQYDNGKVNVNSASGGGTPGMQPGQAPQVAQQQQQHHQQHQQQQQGSQQGGQQRQQQQGPNAATPQQQQYYQQYNNAYAGHQQQNQNQQNQQQPPSATTASYGNYPYRQYWG